MGLAVAARAATPLDSTETFKQLPLSFGSKFVHVGEPSAELLSDQLPGASTRVVAAIAKLFNAAPTGPNADKNAIGSAGLPGVGMFDLNRGHDLPTHFWQYIASSHNIPGFANGLPAATSGENVFYIRGQTKNIWKTSEFTFRGNPVWMSADFVVTLSELDGGTRVDVRQLATLLPGRRVGMNAHTMMPTSMFDWRPAPQPTNRERQMLLDMIRREWTTLSAQPQNTQSPWPARVVERDAFNHRLPMLLNSKRLHVEAVQIRAAADKPNEAILSYQIANDDDQPLTFPAGTTLPQAIGVWRGFEPTVSSAKSRPSNSLQGVAYGFGFSQDIPKVSSLQARERISVQERVLLKGFAPDNYRVHVILQAWKTSGKIHFDSSTDTGVSFDFVPDSNAAGR